jgi:hypothetical protein
LDSALGTVRPSHPPCGRRRKLILSGVSNRPGLIAPRLQVLVAASLVCLLVVCAVSRRQSS